MNSRKTFNKSIFATLLLICFICAVFFIVSVNVDHMTTDACFDTLDDATVEAASMVRASVENDREQLNVIADLLSQHDIHDIKTIKSHLASFRQRGTLSSIGLLLPDNQLILGMEEENIPEIALDYNTELKKAPYISGVTDAADNTGKKFIYQAIPMEKDGQTTGILYEHSLESYGEKQTDTLCCLYIDANGLHELNNSLGHAAGDAMLMSIGYALKTLFSPQDCYRIGGDEFIVFCTDYDKVQLSQRIDQLKERMTSSGYAISIGVAWLNESFDVKDMVSIAEKEMYEAKRLYYEQSDNAPKARIINQKMEHIILEKKDRDAFLDAISSRFMGVYVVNMQTDSARIIYKPSYFSEILDDNHSRFMPSMQSYINSYVAKDDRKVFLDFLNYDSIRNQFLSENVITFFYHKEDGNKLVLQIYPTRDYAPDNPESIWLFEKDAN